MANFLWVGFNADKLVMQSGEVTSTVKDSLVITAVTNTPFGQEWDGTNTLTLSQGLDIAFLLSGQYTTTVKTSQSMTTVDSAPLGISEDGTDTYLAGNASDKMYKVSGKFTTTVKDSLGVLASSTPAGVSATSSDVWYSEEDVVSKLAIISGKMTSTIKVSLDITAVNNNIFGISPSADKSNTFTVGNTGDKLYVLSGHGQFTTTVKSSTTTTGETNPRSCTTDNVTNRLGVVASGGFFGKILDNDVF
jgi:hypothetical protein